MSASKRAELGQIVIRPPEGMRERIKAAAEANNRSMNAEIVATLEEKYPAEPPDLARILYETLELIGVLDTMQQRDRIAFVGRKEKQIHARGFPHLSLELEGNQLVLKGENFTQRLGLREPFPDSEY